MEVFQNELLLGKVFDGVVQYFFIVNWYVFIFTVGRDAGIPVDGVANRDADVPKTVARNAMRA